MISPLAFHSIITYTYYFSLKFQFTITADQVPPPLDDESYYCVFGDLGSSLLEGNLIPGVMFTDLTCNYSFTVEQFSNGSDGMCIVINNEYCLMTYY